MCQGRPLAAVTLTEGVRDVGNVTSVSHRGLSAVYHQQRPVTKLASSLARKRTQAAISSGSA